MESRNTQRIQIAVEKEAQDEVSRNKTRILIVGGHPIVHQGLVELINHSLFFRMKRWTYEYGRSMTWPKIGKAYWKLFCSQAPYVTRALRTSVDSQDWTIPAYNRQAIFQPA